MAEGGYKKSGKRYRGVVKAVDCFMARWHRDEARKSRLRHAAEDAESGDEGKEGGRRTGTAVDEPWNEVVDRVIGWLGIGSTSPRFLAVFVCF